MRTLKPTQTWILICLMTVVSSGTTEHAPLHHDATQHGDSTAQKIPQNTIVPFGIQIPEHVLSTQDVACISADDNIFQIMNEAQKTCNGTDMRCTFYHFVNHGYENIGTLDVNKESFDDLLMKFDNWLLTAEKIDKNDVNGKTKEGNSVDTASINGNDRYKNDEKVANSKANGQTNNGRVDHESDDDIIHGHHVKNPDETHHKNHHHKWKNGNHIKLDTEYNNEHRYFEVFLPKDKETGKPRTIYVEVDRDKNEFVLLDEDIDKKLNGIKPIKIELDELSEIADTAFSDIVKSSYHKGHIYNNLDEDDRVMASDLKTISALDDHEIHLDIDGDEDLQDILNSSVCNPNICNINVNQLLISNNATGNVKKVINVSKNTVVPNKYINQAQFHVESHRNNTANMMSNNNFEIAKHINDTDIYGKELFNTIEFDHNNITELDINNEDNSSLEFIKIPCETENRNCTENNEFSIDHENITYDDNDFIQLVDNNESSNEINFDDTHDFASSNTVHLKDPILKDKENKMKSTPDIYVTPESTLSMTAGMSDNIGSHLNLFENQEEQTDLDNLVSNMPISSYTTIPILGKDLAKVLEMDSNLQSSFPVYATFNLSASNSQNSSVHPTVPSNNSPLDSVHGQQTIESKIPQYISPKFPSSPVTQPSMEFSGRPVSISPDHTIPVEDPRLFPNLPSLSFDVQNPCSFQSPLYLDAETLTSPKHVLPTKVDFPSTTPLSVMPDSLKEVLPCPFQPLPPYIQPTKDNSGFNSPFDNNFKDAMVPCSGNRNRYPCNTIPYFLNPYLKPQQFIPQYFDPQLTKTSLQPTPKFPALDSPPISLDQSYTYLNTDYPRETKPIPLFPFAPNTPFSPLNPPWIGSGFIPNTCPSLWNNIPYQNMPSLPYGLPAQNMWNYPPTFNNYLAPPMELQQGQLFKTSPTKDVLEDTYPTTNILQMTPSTYAPLASFYPRPVQMDLNPSFSLERDLQTLSCKYGIPLSKILDSLESLLPFESPCSTLKHYSSVKGKSTSSTTNAGVSNDDRSGNEEILLESDLANLIPLDSSLIGPHLDIDNASLLGSNDYQTYTVASETTGPHNANLSLKNQTKQMFKDNSLIVPHLSTLSSSNFQLSDEDRIENVELHLQSDYSSLMPLDSSPIGSQLEIRPSEVLDSIVSQGSIVTSHTEIPGTLTSQIKTKLNIQNLPAKFSLDSSLKGPHLATLSEAKPLFNGEIQSINDMIPLESDFTELTPLDSSQVDLVNELEHSEILQHEKTAVTLSAFTDSAKLFKPVETKPNLIEDEFLHLDSSLIGPQLQTGSSIIHTGSVEQKTVPEITQDSHENATELENIILPPSMLPKLLINPVTADLKLNVDTQNAQLNEEHSELSLGTNADLPITHISPITPSLKETVFQILEPTLVQPKTVKHKLKSPGIIHVADSEMQLDRYFQDPSPHHKIKTTEMSSNLDSSIQLDNYLIGPSILHETDSREMSSTFDHVDHPKSSIAAKFANQNKKPLTVSAAIDSEIEYDNSLSGPILDGEIKAHASSTSSNFVTQLDKSLIVPYLHETIGSSATSSDGLISETETIDESRAFDSKNILDNSLVGPHLTTTSFSTDEIKMINKELQFESDLVHLKPLDSSLVGSHLDFESQLDESEISRYQNPELTDLVEEESPLQPNAVPTVCPSELQELLSKFTNAITKSHLSLSEMKPCDKLLSSISKISSNSKNIPFEDLQTYSQLLSQDDVASEFSPIPLTVLEQNLVPVESIAKCQPCIDSNYFPTPVTFPQYAHAKEAPLVPIMPYSPFLQMKPLIHHNWQEPPLNIHNILKGSSGLRPVAESSPIPFISNSLELSPEEFNLLLDLTSQSNLYPQLSIPNIFRPGEVIAPLSEWTIPSQILPADKYIPLLPKKSPIVLPSNLESTVCDTEYNPVVINDIMSLINENSHQLLKDTPYSKSSVLPTISEFDRGDILSPSFLDYIKATPVLPNPLNNAIITPSLYKLHKGMYNAQNIVTPYIPPYNLQPYTYLPEEAQFSEIIEPAPKLISLPTQSPNVFLESQWNNIKNDTKIPQFIESVANPLLEKEYLQLLLSKPCLDSPIVLPSSALEALLQLPTASNELTNAPCQSTPLYFPAISPMYSTSLSNSFTSPLLPSYTSPLSVSSAKAISTPSTSLPLNLPYTGSPIASPTLSMNPYTTSPFASEFFSSPPMPVKTELSDYTYLPTVAQNIPKQLAVPYKPCHTYSSPYIPVQPSPMPIDTSPYSPFISKPTPTYSPAYGQPISAHDLGLPAYSDTVTPVFTSPIAPTKTGILSSKYLSPDPSFSYTLLPKTNTQDRPSRVLSPAYLTPISQESPNFSINIRYLTSNPISSAIPKITNQELQLVRPICAMPGSYEKNPFSNANKMLPIIPNIPIPSYSTLVSKLSHFSNSKTKQNIPYGTVIQSNLQTSPLTEEEPFYNVIEENMYTHSNDRDKYYQEPSFKYPLESMSYTLAPEEITETFPDEDLIKPEDLVTYSPLPSLTSKPSLQTKVHERLFLTPYTSLSGKPCSLPLSLAEVQQNIFDNISLMPPSNPLKYPASQTISILSSPLLKPLTPFTPASNLPILTSPCMHTSLNPYTMLPFNKEPLLSSPYYSTTSQNIVPPFLQVPMNTPSTPVSPITLSQPSLPVIPNNLILLPPSNDPKSLSFPNYNQYSAPIISHFPPIEETAPCKTPLSLAQNFKKMKPQFSPQYMPSILPAPTTYQNSIPLNEAPIHYQPFITPPTELVSSAQNILMSPAVTSPYTVLPSFNNIPFSTDLYKPSSPVLASSPTVPLSTCLPVTTPKTAKQALTNHIIPSSLFTIPDTARYTSQKKLSAPHNIPRYSLPSPTFVEPLEILSTPLGNTVLSQNILKPNRKFASSQFSVPQSSLPYLTESLQPKDSYPAQPTNDQYNSKPHPKLLPVSTQYATSYFTPLQLETVPNKLTNKPQYGLPSVPIYDTTIHTSSSGRNPFFNPKFKPIPPMPIEVPSYPVPNNLMSSPKITPFDSFLLSNLRPLDVSQDPFESYSEMSSLPPLSSSSLLKPLTKTLSQKSRLHQPEINPINSQYVSPIEINPQLLPSTSPILNSILLKPLLANSQNIAPCLPMHISRLNTVSPESTPTHYIPSVTGPSTYQLTEIPETVEQLNILPTTPYSLFKSRFNKLQQTPVTKANMPFYSNYDIVQPSPEPSMKANIVSIAKPIEVSALHSSLLSRNSFDPEIMEEIEPVLDSKYRLSPLPMNLSQQRPFNPAYDSIPKPSSKYISSKPRPYFSVLSSSPDDVELIDTTDFSPLSQMKSEPLIADYSSIDRQASIIKNIPPTNPDIPQFSPYSTLLNTEGTSSTYMKLLPKLQAQSYSNQFSRLPPLFLSPQEYKELIQGPSISDGSSSTNTNTEPQLVSSQLTEKPRTVPLYTSPIPSKPPGLLGIGKPGSWLQSATLEKYLIPLEIPVEVTPEKQSIESLLNKYRPFNKLASQGVNIDPSKLISLMPEQNIVKPGPNTESEDKYSNDFNEYDSENMPYDHESVNINIDENRLGSIETKSLTETLPENVKGLNIPSYNEMTQRPQRLSKLDYFYANNHIGQSPQVFTVPKYKTLPADLKSSSTTISPENFKELTDIPDKYFGAIPKLHTASQMGPDDYYPENVNTPKNNPITNSHPQTYLNPYIKPFSQRKSRPLSTDTSEMPYQPTSYIPDNNIDGIKYSGYKTYQMPSLKSPKSTLNPGAINDPTLVTFSPPILASKYSQVQQNPNNSQFYRPTEIYELQNTESPTQVNMTTPLQTILGLDTLEENPELNEYGPLIPQYQTPVDMTTPLQSKLELNTLQESTEYDEYNPLEDVPLSVDNINEDNELKTSLINYINTRGDIKNNLDNSDGALTIPIGNIAITKKEPCNSETIETNNPSIGLKVWKSNVKVAQAELKLKFKDMSVNNFMPVVNNLDKYDMEEIRKIVKNYIDEKYGAHIEVNEPYTIDNKYSIIKDFDHDAAENKYNLLWPAHYV